MLLRLTLYSLRIRRICLKTLEIDELEAEKVEKKLPNSSNLDASSFVKFEKFVFIFQSYSSPQSTLDKRKDLHFRHCGKPDMKFGGAASVRIIQARQTRRTLSRGFRSSKWWLLEGSIVEPIIRGPQTTATKTVMCRPTCSSSSKFPDLLSITVFNPPSLQTPALTCYTPLRR
jgi:hypothetical protein